MQSRESIYNRTSGWWTTCCITGGDHHPAPPDTPGRWASGPGDATGRANVHRAGERVRPGPGGRSVPILIIPSRHVPRAGGPESKGGRGGLSPPYSPFSLRTVNQDSHNH